MAKPCPHCGSKLPGIFDISCPACLRYLEEIPPTPPKHIRAGSDVGPGQMMYDVWYATEERVFRWIKLSLCDDRGSMDTLTGTLRFTGKRTTINMRHVLAAELVGPVIPWATVFGLFMANVLILLSARAGMFRVLTFDNPESFILLAGINVFGFTSAPMNWVKVSFQQSEQDQSQTAFFASGSLMSRLVGGTRRLWSLLRQQLK